MLIGNYLETDIILMLQIEDFRYLYEFEIRLSNSLSIPNIKTLFSALIIFFNHFIQ